MKACIFYTVMILLAMPLNGQGVYIGNSALAPENHTILEVESTSKGVLFPRMDPSQLLAVSNPEEGLMAYNTTDSILAFYNGTRWMNVDGTAAYFMPGDLHQGGVVFEVDATGLHGKIVSLNDQGMAAWGCRGTEITGADSNSDGATNTSEILADCADPGIAAELCDDYSVIDDGETYDDWYLPALDDLSTIYSVQSEIGALTYDFYYSSTERSSVYAYGVKFHDNGNTGWRYKDKLWYVRAIRDF